MKRPNSIHATAPARSSVLTTLSTVLRRELRLLIPIASLFIFTALAFADSTTAELTQLREVSNGESGPVKAQHLTVELVSLSPRIAPGGTLQAGLLLSMEDHWHVYWINAGDSGQPPKIKWILPAGITAGPMQFRAPTRLPLGPLMDYGYENHVAFPVKLTATETLKPGTLHLKADVNWLVCFWKTFHIPSSCPTDPFRQSSPQPGRSRQGQVIRVWAWARRGPITTMSIGFSHWTRSFRSIRMRAGTRFTKQ